MAPARLNIINIMVAIRPSYLGEDGGRSPRLACQNQPVCGFRHHPGRFGSVSVKPAGTTTGWEERVLKAGACIWLRWFIDREVDWTGGYML
jgi:hypothetical protein